MCIWSNEGSEKALMLLKRINMKLTSTYWYEIVYSNGERLFFQFLDTTENGNIRCRLCNGQESTQIYRGRYMEIIEHGEQNPCEQR